MSKSKLGRDPFARAKPSAAPAGAAKPKARAAKAPRKAAKSAKAPRRNKHAHKPKAGLGGVTGIFEYWVPRVQACLYMRAVKFVSRFA